MGMDIANADGAPAPEQIQFDDVLESSEVEPQRS